MDSKLLNEIAAIIGDDRVLYEKSQIEPYGHSGVAFERIIAAVVRPIRVDEIIKIVNLANKFGIALYPISTGNNWGYGSANPVRDHCIILDMSDMKGISVNNELAYAVVEPGVTQEDLYTYLEKNKTGLIMDPTGSGPSCSVLGNTLERGYGISPYGDHFSYACGMEIVLADGSLLRTGFGHFQNSRVSQCFKWGVGPYLDGIFTQSNFGIITKMGIWLMPKPEYFEACYFSCENEKDLFPLIDSVRSLLLHNVVKSSINLVHRDRALTMLMQYPWDEMGGGTPLSEEVSRQLAEQRKVGAWNGVCGLYGTKEEVKAAKKIVKKNLKGKVSRINFISQKLLGLLEKYPKLLSMISGMDISELLTVLKSSFGILSGKPAEVSLVTPYWRSRKAPPDSKINPVKDNCGIYWFAPVVPMTQKDASIFIKIIRPILREFGFDTLITFTTVTPRAFDCNLPIIYDKDSSEERKKAKECYEAVFEACMKKGYIPYRIGIQSMASFTSDTSDPFWNTVSKIKQALDPEGILSPGRYSRE